MFTSTNLRLAYPRTEYRIDERILKYHGITFYHIDDDPSCYQEYDASILFKDGKYVVYGDKTPEKTFESLDSCIYYVVGGEFVNWRDNWRACGIPIE